MGDPSPARPKLTNYIPWWPSRQTGKTIWLCSMDTGCCWDPNVGPLEARDRRHISLEMYDDRVQPREGEGRFPKVRNSERYTTTNQI